MTSTSQSPLPDLRGAENLKRELSDFVTSGPLKQEYEEQLKLFFSFSDKEDEGETDSVLDYFLFDWVDEKGDGAIEHFLASRPDLSEDDQETLIDWTDSVNTVFEIKSLGKNSLKLRELDTGDEFPVVTLKPLDQTPFKRGQFIAARLLPLDDKFIFSGLQFIMPDREAAMEALEMRRALDSLYSPEALESAQQEQVKAFCELFGCDELSVPPAELNSTLGKFQRYLFEDRRDPETGMTPAEKFHEEFGRDLSVPEMPPLPIISGAGEVTILCDDFDGIVLLPDYKNFQRVFELDEPEGEIPNWQDLIWNYIKDPELPIVAFERVAERDSDRVEKVLRRLLGDDDFSVEHLYAVLLHYKQPVEGLDDLSDDQQLWDLFNGNAPPEKGRANAPVATATKKASASKQRPAKKSPAKKSAAKKSTAKKVAAKKLGSKKAAAKRPAASKAGGKAKAGASKAGKRAPAKKR
ncbi:MAG TPA: hypothetical protein VKA70_08320 [Blastocatellia bacterium]|nr:hypothetical protein [Blastocatellia bacterium]